MKNYSAKILVPGLLLLSWLVHYYFYGEMVQAYYLFPVAVVLFFLFNPKNSSPALAGLVLVWSASMLDAAGNNHNFYQTYSWFDSLTHFFGIFSITMLFIPWLPRFFPGSPSWKIGLIAVLLAIFIGNLYEVGELWVQNIGNFQVIWGEEDTSQDLQWNILGALAAFLIWEAYAAYKYRVMRRLTGISGKAYGRPVKSNNKTTPNAPGASPGGLS